jgi:hypothetical protein
VVVQPVGGGLAIVLREKEGGKESDVRKRSIKKEGMMEARQTKSLDGRNRWYGRDLKLPRQCGVPTLRCHE